MFKQLWRRLGLSVDWRQEYQTIDDHCRRIAQLSFRDLFEKGEVYTTEAPTMWDVDFQTAVAQAEVEDKVLPGAFHDIEFGVEGSDAAFVIATTRPELLPACVGVTAHPDDERYKQLFGKRAVTPLFHAPVPIFPSEMADPEKGTGILMVCTFGDATDVQWWREEGLALRQVIGRNGRLRRRRVRNRWPVHEPRARSRPTRPTWSWSGKNVKQAQARIVEMLREPDGSATGHGAPLQGEPEAIEHPVKFFEKGDRPLEFVPTRQWFAKLLDKKEALLAKGEEVQWHPRVHGRALSRLDREAEPRLVPQPAALLRRADPRLVSARRRRRARLRPRHRGRARTDARGPHRRTCPRATRRRSAASPVASPPIPTSSTPGSRAR